MNSQVYENSIKNFIKVLKIFQINIFAKKRNVFHKLLSFFNYFLLTSGLLLPFVSFIQLDDKDVVKYAKDIIYIFGFTQTSLKTTLFFIYHKNLRTLHKWAKSLYTTKYNEDIREIAMETLDAGAKYMSWLINIIIIAFNLTVIFVGVGAFFGDTPWSVLSSLPGVSSTLANKFHQLIAMAIALNNALCYDTFFMISVSHIYIKLTTICRILEMLDNDKSLQYLKATNKVDGILIEIHTMYIEIINVINLINSTFEFGIIALFVTTLPLQCFSFYFINYEPNNVNGGYMIILTCVVQLFFYSLFGHLIDTKIEMVTNLAYCTKWYELSIGQQKSIKIFLIMVQKGVKLRGIFFELSLANFVSMEKAAITYAAMIKSFA